MTSSAGSAGAHPHALLSGMGVALGLHGLVALALLRVPAQATPGQLPLSVEIEVVQPPPPAEPVPPPALEPPPPPREPHLASRRRAPVPPPMPNRETKAKPAAEEPAQAVFGVTEDSVLSGTSPVAVPVGNTLMTNDRNLAKAPPAVLPPAPPSPAPFAPVDEDYVTEWPKEPTKPKPEYPEAARRMGIGGRVTLKIGIDRKGNVQSVRLLQKAGYGMDEAAVKAIRVHHFTPAKGRNGEPVDIILRYDVVFDPQGQ